VAISAEVSSGVQPRKSIQQYTLHELPVQSAEPENWLFQPKCHRAFDRANQFSNILCMKCVYNPQKEITLKNLQIGYFSRSAIGRSTAQINSAIYSA